MDKAQRRQNVARLGLMILAIGAPVWAAAFDYQPAVVQEQVAQAGLKDSMSARRQAIHKRAKSRHKKGGPMQFVVGLLGLGMGLTAFMVWGRATFIPLARRADRVIADNSAWRTFWVGAVSAIGILLLAILIVKVAQSGIKPLGLLALAVLAGGAVLAFRGGMGVWPSYGHRILGAEDAPTDLSATLAGGALLTGLSLLFPVGLFFLAYVMVRSLGAGVMLSAAGAPAAVPKKEPAEDKDSE